MEDILYKVLDTDTEEVKKGKEALNTAFKSMDAAQKKGLADLQEKLTKEIEGERTKSATLEAALKKIGEDLTSELKTRDDSIQELKDSLTEMSRINLEGKKDRAKGIKEIIYEELSTKTADVQKFLENKAAGLGIQMKTVGNMGVVANSFAPLFQPIVGPAHELVHARNFIPVSPTSSALIRYVRFTNKDGIITTTLINSTKNQIDYTETVVDAPVIKITGFINVADEFLQDIDGSSSFLADELPARLYDAEDTQVFKGDGTTGNLAGLYTNATALSLPYAGVTDTSNNIDKIAAGATYVRRQKRRTTAAWLSPEDYLAIWINKSTGATQVYNYPIRFNDNNNMMMIGDIPVIEHTVFNPSEGMVGDFATGCRIFQKVGASLQFSTENNDNFQKNVTTVRIEERIALANYYPETFVKFTLSGYAS